jgi:hypothetical protein
MQKRNSSKTSGALTDVLTRTKNALDAFQNLLPERNISAMGVAVWYVAKVGHVVHSKRGEEHAFRITYELNDGQVGQKWEERLLNAYAARDEFLGIKDWSEALEFLGRTGIFSPLGHSITWSEFQRWQRFASLVQEHDGLAATMRSGNWSGENGEVLKALTGIYQTSFFAPPMSPETETERKWRANSDVVEMIREGQAHHERMLRELYAWFREPAASASSIQWVPKNPVDKQSVWRQVQQQSGAMLEFLLPQSELQPVLLIRPQTTLHAIAAAIYGDRIHGIEYRACEMCNALFKLGSHREKKYCDRERCKNRAHQRNRRVNARTRNARNPNGLTKKGNVK